MNWIEKRIMAAMNAAAGKAGYKVVAVWDGEERIPVKSFAEAQRIADGYDEIYLIYKNAKGEKEWIRYIFGNGNKGWDVVCDYSIANKVWEDALQVVMDKVCDEVL